MHKVGQKVANDGHDNEYFISIVYLYHMFQYLYIRILIIVLGFLLSINHFIYFFSI